jgi:hypothetical protein
MIGSFVQGSELLEYALQGAISQRRSMADHVIEISRIEVSKTDL